MNYIKTNGTIKFVIYMQDIRHSTQKPDVDTLKNERIFHT